jgi:hypothetical protein
MAAPCCAHQGEGGHEHEDVILLPNRLVERVIFVVAGLRH